MNRNSSGRNYGKGNRIFFQLNVIARQREPSGGWVQANLKPVSTLDAPSDFAFGVLGIAGRPPRPLYIPCPC